MIVYFKTGVLSKYKANFTLSNAFLKLRDLRKMN